jgi:hypothetical protein
MKKPDVTDISFDQEGPNGDGPTVTCSDCGFQNPANEEFCQACNASIGRVDPSASGDASTGRYKAIRAAVEQVQTGAMPVDRFARWLEETSTVMANKARGIMDTIEACNYWQEGAEEIEVGLSGVQSFEEGLGELYAYTQDGEPAHLEQGLVMVWEGTQRIIEAMRINRDSRQDLALEWEQLQGGLDELKDGHGT